jgi:hypothetical protein
LDRFEEDLGHVGVYLFLVIGIFGEEFGVVFEVVGYFFVELVERLGSLLAHLVVHVLGIKLVLLFVSVEIHFWRETTGFVVRIVRASTDFSSRRMVCTLVFIGLVFVQCFVLSFVFENLK